MPAIDVTHNPAMRRFEVDLGRDLAVLEYERSDNDLLITHTEVPPAHEGKGIASALTVAALDHARDEQLRVVPLCAFAVAYLRGHPEYTDLTH